MSLEMNWPEDNVADEIYHIHCRVSGGVTGTREGVLKEDGEPVIFYSREEAEATARRYHETMNRNSNGARFDYWVVAY